MTTTKNETTDTMPEAEVRQLARELLHENRRLRQILDTLARAGLGTGAVVELVIDRFDTARVLGVTVCRADRDEAAFVKDVLDGMHELAAAFFRSTGLDGDAVLGDPRRTGSTRDHDGGDDR